ncbi:MAG: hypothetical protein K2X27_18355 [Candidatus Obscuribacterales bacterium]|nr:hypothetical protein [Candidatus Obscuribacterales bacterium]
MDITDIGPFKRIWAPADWKRKTLKVTQGNRLDLPVLLLTIPGLEDELEIGIFYRGKLESPADGENFHALLQRHKTAEAPVALSPGQIRSLSRVLNLAGFNQYTFPKQLTGYNADFQLRTAQVVVLNGRPVLMVDGEFRADESADAFFGCLFVEADDSGRKIYELYLKAADKELYLRSLNTFRQVTESIEWAK